MPGFNEEIEAVAKRTAEVMGTFMKNYGVALVSAQCASLMDGALEEVTSEMKDVALQVVKGKKAEEGPSEEEKATYEKIVGAKVTGRSKEKDVDTSQYTAFTVVSCNIAPKGSNLQHFKTRYRSLLKLNKTLVHDMKDTFPEGQKFPPKRIFGNKEEKFLETRQHELNDWFTAVSHNETVATVNTFLQAMQLEKDEKAEFNHAVFVDAFNATCSELGIYVSQDADEFEDEGPGLIVLVLAIAEKEIFPKLEEKINALPTGRNVARKAAQSAIASAIGKGVQKAWEQGAEKVDKLKKAMNDKLAESQDQVQAVLKQILGKLTPIIIEKLAKPKPEVPEEEKKEFEPTAEQLPAGKQIKELLLNEQHVVASVKKIQDEIKDQFKLKDRINKEVDEFLKMVPDRDLQHVIGVAKSLMNGISDLWLKLMDTLLTGLQLFFKVREELEDKLVAAGNAEAAKPEIDKAIASLKGSLRDYGLQLAGVYYEERASLKFWYLRNLTAEASGALLSTVLEVPQNLLNFLAQYRLNLAKNLPGIYAKGSDEATVRQEFRRVFVDSGMSDFNSFFGKSWVALTTGVNDAVRVTFVDTLSKSATEVVEPIVQQIQDSIQMPGGIDIVPIMDVAVNKILDALAGKTLAFAKAKLENCIFTVDA